MKYLIQTNSIDTEKSKDVDYGRVVLDTTDSSIYVVGYGINYKAVDLGLTSGTLWMDRNVGAEKDTDYGLYFAWGETEGYSGITTNKQFSWDDYKYYDISNSVVTKYNGTDSLTTLETTDDAVLQNIRKFVMPTEAQLNELIAETTYTWTTKDGVNGGLFTSKVNSNSIFVPAAGECNTGSQYSVGVQGFLWSSSLLGYTSTTAYSLALEKEGVVLGKSHRYEGCPVRGVVSSSK